MSYADARKYLVLVPESNEWNTALAEIDRKIADAEEIMASANQKYGALGSSIEDTISITRPAQAAAFVWPYILISALSMKLARRRHSFRAP
jgi:hypothetical protein